ncbi:MAG: acyl carrier protein [Verrucomicrobiae bacterium]|nr:acyl carrier protein [Verrucomicrobiae bacterium]
MNKEGADPVSSPIEEGVIRAISKVAQGRTVLLESTFEDLGLDSLAIIEAVFEIEETFDIRVPDEEAKSIRTVREAIEGVERLVAGEGKGGS